MLRRLITENIDLATFPAAGEPRVRADRTQIEQVLMNLAVNAKDAMPDGGRLTIETADVELSDAYARRRMPVIPGRYVLLAVSDTGCGMNHETLNRVFEPFFTTKERGQGTGLGLSVVYGIVKQSGGYIWPCYQVLIADNSERALEVAAAHDGPIHLVLTDVIMPGMSTSDLVAQLSAVRAGIRILYMSGYADHAVARSGLLDGQINFIQKPFAPERLAHKVREVLAQSES